MVFFSSDTERLPIESLYREIHTADIELGHHRYSSNQLREDFLWGRYLLRRTLASFVGEKAFIEKFEISNFGKPFLPNTDFDFSISHSQGNYLIGVISSGKIGVDIEKTNKDISILDIAEIFMHPQEYQKCLENKGCIEKEIYKMWVKKEAFLKMIGKGFWIDPININLFSVENKTLIDLEFEAEVCAAISFTKFK